MTTKKNLEPKNNPHDNNNDEKYPHLVDDDEDETKTRKEFVPPIRSSNNPTNTTSR
jgi:hypothetical protein